MDSLCLPTGVNGVASSILANGAIEVRSSLSQVSAVGKSSMINNLPQKMASTFAMFSFTYPLKSLWFGGRENGKYNGMAVDSVVSVENEHQGIVMPEEEGEIGPTASEGKNRNWVSRDLQSRSQWGEVEEKRDCVGRDDDEKHGDEEEEECDTCNVVAGDDEDEVVFDKDSFWRLLRRVSLVEARMYAKMSYSGCLAYCIPKIKPENLLRNYRLQFITSSLEKKELAMKAEKTQLSAESKEVNKDLEESKESKNIGHRISASAAYEISVSAASHLHSHTKSILSSKTSNPSDCSPELSQGTDPSVDMVDSVTAVVAAREEVKQAVADNLNSTHSSPCDWYICDDDQTGTRYFVIQGSESLSSWQANLLFEPVQFEGLDVVVHRGIYEAAKGMYVQMLPEIRAHLKSREEGGTLKFTGHSLGGSLALLVNLMLLIRREVPVSSLLPVITYGAPSIMCGGDLLLRRLRLPRNHVQSVIMHRDIVPRAFSCKYPNHVVELLKAINGSFRNHPCLNNQKLLFAPMGEVVILQPDERFSPSHHLLPPGSGLYRIMCPISTANDGEKKLQAAQRMFLNSPHPLEILSDPSAYGSGGTIQRDHDMSSYLKCVRGVIRLELNHIRKSKRAQRRKIWQPLVHSDRIRSNIIMEQSVATMHLGQNQINLSGFFQRGRESFKHISRLVATQQTRLILILLLPARLLLVEVHGHVNILE